MFSLILIDEQGHIVGESKESSGSSFHHTLVIKPAILRSGKYTLIVDTNWEDNAHDDPDYLNVNVRVFTAEKFSINSVEKSKGLTTLRDALKIYGVSAQNKKYRNFYRNDFGKELWSI